MVVYIYFFTNCSITLKHIESVLEDQPMNMKNSASASSVFLKTTHRALRAAHHLLKLLTVSAAQHWLFMGHNLIAFRLWSTTDGIWKEKGHKMHDN